VYKNWSHEQNPNAKQKPTIQKFWKKCDKKVEIMMNTTQKISLNLD
jgi:hypothetical protein